VQTVGACRAFREGVIVEALNPKTAAFFLAFIPQFVDLSAKAAAQFIGLANLGCTQHERRFGCDLLSCESESRACKPTVIYP
jgi:hypothetical protein